MPGVTLPPDQMATLSRLTARVERLERRTRAQDALLQRMLASLFTYPGDLVVTTESPRWYPEMDVILSQTRASLLAAASGTVTVAIRKNGATLYSVSLTAGQTTVVNYTPTTLNSGDYLTVRVDAIGTNGANLSVGFVPSIGAL